MVVLRSLCPAYSLTFVIGHAGGSRSALLDSQVEQPVVYGITERGNALHTRRLCDSGSARSDAELLDQLSEHVRRVLRRQMSFRARSVPGPPHDRASCRSLARIFDMRRSEHARALDAIAIRDLGDPDPLAAARSHLEVPRYARFRLDGRRLVVHLDSPWKSAGLRNVPAPVRPTGRASVSPLESALESTLAPRLDACCVANA